MEGVGKCLDYYGVLGITREAQPMDIKKAYRRLALEYRRKEEEGAAARLLVAAGEAYEVLSSALLRAVYDQYGERGLAKGVLTPAGWLPPYTYHGDSLRTYREFFGTTSPYADLLELVRDPPKVEPATEGGFKVKQPNIHKDLPLTLQEVYLGCMKKMKVMRKEWDEGVGATVEREVVLTVQVRPGTPSATQVVFPSTGDSTPTQMPGDLVYTVVDKPDEVYWRQGLDLHMCQTVALNDALSGLILPLTTLDQRYIKVRITDVIRPDYVKIVYGEGMPHPTEHHRFGNLHIHFNVVFPQYIPKGVKSFVDRGLVEAKEAEDELFNKPKKVNTDSILQCPALQAN